MLFATCVAAQQPPQPIEPLPTPQQVAWHEMETYAFIHFGPNTFLDREWGYGDVSPESFRPTRLDCEQWVRVCKAAGMKGIILTAKHHDGFCLWPSKYTDYSVLASPYKDGKGDVVGELAAACRKYGLGMGLYLSPWDRHQASYGTPLYVEFFHAQLEELLTQYGELFEVWFDGANGEGPNGKKQTYNWPLFNSTVAQLQPNAVIFSDVGPGCRWVGNENGQAGFTCWSTLNIDGFTPGNAPALDTLNQGNMHGSYWIPAETDVSIRPGWFWHQNEHPKSLDELLTIYYNSVGRNSLLLLNVPPDRRGLIPYEDSLRLMELRAAIDSIFAINLAKQAKITASNTRGKSNSKKYNVSHLVDDNYHSYWATDDSVLCPTLSLDFQTPITFSRIMLQEYIPLGQRIAAFHVEYLDNNGNWNTLTTATTIGYKRILLTPTVTTSHLRIVIDHSLAPPILNHIFLS